jgi:hypothetical protein
VDAFHRRARGAVVLRRHDLRVQAEWLSMTSITVRLVNVLPPHLMHLEQK